MKRSNLEMNYYIEEIKEYKKLIEKFEDEIKKIQNDKISLSKENDEMKLLISQLGSENNNLKKKIDNLQKGNEEISEINILLKEQINNINLQNQKELDSLRNINNLISYNNTAPIENQTEIVLKLKNAEIYSLKEEILSLTRKNKKLQLDFEDLKKKYELEIFNIKFDKEKMNNINIMNESKEELGESNRKMLDELKLNNIRNESNKIIEQLEKELIDTRNKKENEIKNLEDNFYKDKNKLINQNIAISKNLDSIKNKLSLKDVELVNIQKQINKMGSSNQNLGNKIIFLLNQNNQLQNEIEYLENKIYELNNLIKEREREFDEENNEYKRQMNKLKSELTEYKKLIETKEKEKIKMQKKYDSILDEKRLLLDKIVILQEENELKMETAKNAKLITKNYLNKYLIEKEEEIKNLNEYISKIKKELNKIKEKKIIINLNVKNLMMELKRISFNYLYLR